MSKTFAYVDGWNFYHGINTPDLHPLGFVDLKRLCQLMVQGASIIEKVHYFSATDYRQEARERQEFWWGALRSAGVTVATPGFFGWDHDERGRKEKTTDVRLALQIAEDVRLPANVFDTVILVSGDADFIPALEKAKRHGKRVRIAFPPGRFCEKLKEIDPFAAEITPGELEVCLFDGSGRTDGNIPLSKSLEYGWACRINGQIRRGHARQTRRLIDTTSLRCAATPPSGQTEMSGLGGTRIDDC